MAKEGVILVAVVCLCIAVFTGQTLCWARASNRTATPVARPDSKILQGLTERKQQILRSSEERGRLTRREAWARLLRVSEAQWKIIEPKVDEVQVLGWTTEARALCAISWREQRFSWYRHSQGAPGTKAKAPEEMTEGHKLADELVGLLEDENSKDEQIRQKIDALQKVRENARKELAQMRKELAPLLTTPRQEAVFLIQGHID